MIIAICDSDRTWREKVREYISEYLKECIDGIHFLNFECAEDLLEYSGTPANILFTAIKMSGIDGIEAVKTINRRWKNCQVVYLTDYLNYATEVYQTNHTFFVLKEQFASRIGEVFNKVDEVIKHTPKNIIFSCLGKEKVILTYEDIIFFERNRRVTILETVWGRYEIHEKINEIMEQVGTSEFIRCHNSYIVYLPAVRELHRDFFIMRNGAKILISRSYQKVAREAFTRWVATQISVPGDGEGEGEENLNQ